MRVATTVDGLVTLFYDGSKPLYNDELTREWNTERIFVYVDDGEPYYEIDHLSVEFKTYWNERQSWQQIIVVDGVTEIPEYTFYECENIKRVIFPDTVNRIERDAFVGCKNLACINWSLNIQFIGYSAFYRCNLSSVFIPPRCREIGEFAFASNDNLKILNVPRDTEIGNCIIDYTELFKSSHYDYAINYDHLIGAWLKNMNNQEEFTLHRVCSYFEPTLEMILDTMIEKGGPKAFKVENIIGITPSRYLKENPYAHVTEKEIIEKYVLQMMGEL
ncbi:hypothetical protein CTEN210_00290 [Chaetoceros tenuissimus]|uniref:Leucine-rich repeat domain-containing protein n=1 Tax=Chaetoceros tenuissimus TaxID=426638 RepID=A0AAD3GY95_9STRA|nr:hypothetical protein CTEN210_00290 [Chaetoceros tenuissimus]